MKFVRDRTIPIILSSGKNILKCLKSFNIGYNNLGTRQIQCRLGSKVCLFIVTNVNKKSFLFWKHLKTHFRITIPIKGCFSFMWCKTLQTRKWVCKNYVFQCNRITGSRALMIGQTSAVNTDAESSNLMEITVFDGKTVAQATEFPSRDQSV